MFIWPVKAPRFASAEHRTPAINIAPRHLQRVAITSRCMTAYGAPEHRA